MGVTPPATVRVGLALALTLLLTALVAGGIRRSNRANTVIVGITLAVLTAFMALGLPRAMEAVAALFAGGEGSLAPLGIQDSEDPGGHVSWGAFLHATALLFVAYTGYGRIATLGEEVKEPRRTIPRAIWVALGITALLYMGAAAVALGTVGAATFSQLTAENAAPLQGVARAMGVPLLPLAVGIAAVTAMAGVLLNLLLGLSRVALAMGRRGDLPGILSRVEVNSGSPRVAVAAVGVLIALLVLLGDVRVTCSFSAFTVLLYYGITNLAALRLPRNLRLYPRWVPVLGLGGCVFLAFQVAPVVWVTGNALVLAGILLRWGIRNRRPAP